MDWTYSLFHEPSLTGFEGRNSKLLLHCGLNSSESTKSWKPLKGSWIWHFPHTLLSLFAGYKCAKECTEWKQNLPGSPKQPVFFSQIQRLMYCTFSQLTAVHCTERGNYSLRTRSDVRKKNFYSGGGEALNRILREAVGAPSLKCSGPGWVGLWATWFNGRYLYDSEVNFTHCNQIKTTFWGL